MIEARGSNHANFLIVVERDTNASRAVKVLHLPQFARDRQKLSGKEQGRLALLARRCVRRGCQPAHDFGICQMQALCLVGSFPDCRGSVGSREPRFCARPETTQGGTRHVLGSLPESLKPRHRLHTHPSELVSPINRQATRRHRESRGVTSGVRNCQAPASAAQEEPARAGFDTRKRGIQVRAERCVWWRSRQPQQERSLAEPWLGQISSAPPVGAAWPARTRPSRVHKHSLNRPGARGHYNAPHGWQAAQSSRFRPLIWQACPGVRRLTEAGRRYPSSNSACGLQRVGATR